MNLRIPFHLLPIVIMFIVGGVPDLAYPQDSPLPFKFDAKSGKISGTKPNKSDLPPGMASGIEQIFSALQNSDPALVGIWTVETGGQLIRFIFAENFRYQMQVGQKENAFEESGNYEFADGVLTFKADGAGEDEMTKAEASVSGDLLSMTLNGKKLELTREAVADAPAPTASKPTPSGHPPFLDLNLPPPAPANSPTAQSPPSPAPAGPAKSPNPPAPEQPANPLIGGIWSGVLDGPMGIVMAFYDESVYGIRVVPKVGEVQENEGTYRIDGNVLYTLPKGNTAETAYPLQFLDANTISIRGLQTNPTTLTRQVEEGKTADNADPPIPQGSVPGVVDPAIVGVWLLPEKFRVDFDSGGNANQYLDREASVLVLVEDGTYMYGTMRAFQESKENEIEQRQWCAKDQILYMLNGQWNAVARYQVTATELTLLTQDGGQQVFQKAEPEN